MNYLASPPLCVAYALAGRMDIDLTREPLQGDVRLADIWPLAARGRRRDRAGGRVGHVPPQLRRGVRGRRELERRSTSRPATATRGTRTSTYVKRPPYFEGMGAEPPAGFDADHGRARARAARRQRHHRPHLAGRRDREGLAGRALPARARRRAPRLQLLRVAARQPRGDDARHVRQRAPAQPARAGHRGRRDGLGRRADDDLRRRDGRCRAGRPAVRAGGQGVRVGLLARLGGQGPEPARASASCSPSPTSASTAPTSSAWACCRCSSPTASRSSRSG